MAGDPTGRISHIYEFHRGLTWKPACRVATTANITISTALNNGDTLDGITLATGDRVLVKNQSTASQNGIYIVGATPTRAADMDQDGTTAVPAEEIAGSVVFVISGTANASTIWYTTNAVGGTVGSTSIAWTQFVGSFTNPMTTQDDIIVGGASGVPARLAKGSDSQVLTVDPTTHHLVWATSSAGFANPMTTKGDIIIGDTGGSPIRKAVGSDAQVLTADSASTGGIKWAAAGGSSSTNAPDGKPWNFTPPGSANAMDDEFGDAASQSGPINGLDAKWSKHNLGTAAWLRLSDSYAPGSLGFDIPTGQSTDQWIYQAIPAGACTFAVQFNIEYASDRQMYSLAILDTAGTGVGFRIDTGGGPQIMNITTWQQTSTVVALTPAWNSNTEFWFRPMTLFLRSDGSHNFFASGTLGDRAVRSLLAEVTQNRSFTDAYVAFGRCFGTGVSKATLDYFRRTA